jgi:zinc transport system substrate-binding protein
MTRKPLRPLVAMALLLPLLAACGEDPSDGSDDASIQVVASFYPVAEAAARVGGDRVEVTNLTPAGVEPHDIELTSDDLDALADADLVLHTGAGFQPALDDAIDGRDGPSVDVADGLLESTDDSVDPHFWLDPTLMAEAVDAVEAALVDLDPTGRDTYAANADEYRAELASLDQELAAGLADCDREAIVTAHAAFSYLARRYGLTQEPITGISPDAEPDPERLADLVDLIEREGTTTVFYEALVPRDFAETLADEAGVDTAVLNPIEGLSNDQIEAGEDYVSTMQANLAALEAALGCRPPT